MTLNQLLCEIKMNPFYECLALGKIAEVEEVNELEKEYALTVARGIRTVFDKKPGDHRLFKYVDQNKLLNLYPGYNTVYGPYTFADEFRIEQLLVLFDTREGIVRLKTLYFKRAMAEIREGKKFDVKKAINDYLSLKDIIQTADVVNPDIIRTFYKKLEISNEILSAILDLYPEYKGNSVYEHYSKANKDVYLLFYKDKNLVKGHRLSVLLVESLILKRKLLPDEVLVFKNNRKTDTSLSNIVVTTTSELFESKRAQILDEYGLDIRSLLDLYKDFGYNAVSNVHHYSKNHRHSGRRRVRLYKTDGSMEHNLLLSRALMEVAEGRILDDKMETVDHYDRNKFNDTVDNLRIKTAEEHSKEDVVRSEFPDCDCPLCGKPFKIDYYKYYKLTKKKIKVFCSQSCASKANKTKNKQALSDKDYSDMTPKYYYVDKSTGDKIYLQAKTYKEALKEYDLLSFT